MKNTVSQLQSMALPKQSNVKLIVHTGIVILALAVSMYVYFVGKIVFDVVGRRTAEASINASQSSISTLAVSYLNHLKTLDIPQATTLGLMVSHDTLYASRASTTASVGMAHEL